MLVLLMRNAGRVCARERLLNAVWGLEADPLTNVVDVTVSRIRRKMPHAADMISTIRNYGYRLEPAPVQKTQRAASIPLAQNANGNHGPAVPCCRRPMLNHWFLKFLGTEGAIT